MIRVSRSFKLKDVSSFKKKLFKWSANSDISVFLNSNDYESDIGEYDAILAIGLHSKTQFTKQNSLTKLDDYINQTKDWVFGYLSYDLKNELEKLIVKTLIVFSCQIYFFFNQKKYG